MNIYDSTLEGFTPWWTRCTLEEFDYQLSRKERALHFCRGRARDLGADSGGSYQVSRGISCTGFAQAISLNLKSFAPLALTEPLDFHARMPHNRKRV